MCGRFVPTITTLTGSFRSMRAWIPKHQSMQLKNTKTTQVTYNFDHLSQFRKGEQKKAQIKEETMQLGSNVRNIADSTY